MRRIGVFIAALVLTVGAAFLFFYELFVSVRMHGGLVLASAFALLLGLTLLWMDLMNSPKEEN